MRARRATGSRTPIACTWSTDPAPSSTPPSTSSRRSCRAALASGRRRPSRCARRPRSRRGRAAPSKAKAKAYGKEAEKAVYQQFASELLAMNAKYGLNLTGAPKLNDPDFVYQLVFDAARGERTPKARFAYLFPSADSALISVRLKHGLSDEQRAEAVAQVRAAVTMPQWQLESGGQYVVTGVPVLADELTEVLAASTLRLLLVGVAVMALVLALLFRARLRLLPLAIALGTVSIVFGGLSLLGLPLTMASIAVLPVLLGLAVDYAIQFQAGNSRRVIATAALATAVGFLILLFSPVPMVRGFGALLVVGVGVALALTFTAGAAVLELAGGRSAVGRVRAVGARRRRPRERRAGAAAAGGPTAALGGGQRARGADRRRAAGGVRVGAGQPDRDRLRPAEARPAVLGGGAGSRRAAEGDGHRGGDRRRRRRRRPHRSGRGALDARLPERGPAAQRLQRRGGLRRRRAVPGAVAARSVPYAGAVGDEGAGARAAGRGAAVPVAGGDLARPQDGRAGVRCPARSRWRRSAR